MTEQPTNSKELYISVARIEERLANMTSHLEDKLEGIQKSVDEFVVCANDTHKEMEGKIGKNTEFRLKNAYIIILGSSLLTGAVLWIFQALLAGLTN